ncbi:MAG: glucose-1-phosphate cytidylyltransferase [Armatimonadota bacterium]
MKVVILAGGVGSRLSEETAVKPKPMVEIGNMPILWHIMMHYSHYGYNEFVIALGHKGEYVKKGFADFAAYSGNMHLDLRRGTTEVENPHALDWKVKLVDTGLHTNTAGRIKRLQPYLDGTFFMTFGDSVSTVNIPELLRFHKGHGKLATLTAVHPPPRFGQLVLEGNRVADFSEKPLDTAWINGGFAVLEPEICDEYIEGDDSDLAETWERLSRAGELMAFKHEGFFQPMDAQRDKVYLEKLWDGGRAPWKIWDEHARSLDGKVFGQV